MLCEKFPHCKEHENEIGNLCDSEGSCPDYLPEFKKFGKIGRLNRECIITEKIDGTNTCILVTENKKLFIGSHKRWLSEKEDNHGCYKWCMERKEQLLTLPVGYHYAEMWGSGIQRGYGLVKGEKRLSLFNVSRFCLHNEEPQVCSVDHKTNEPKYQIKLPECLSLVPIIGRGLFCTSFINGCFEKLRQHGSFAVEKFDRPEGIIVFHTANGVMFKYTFENDVQGKGQVE